MEDWTEIDDVCGDMTDMLHVLVKKYKLISGDISPEDMIDLARIICNYRQANKPTWES